MKDNKLNNIYHLKQYFWNRRYQEFKKCMENVLFSNMKQEQKSYKEELRGNIQNEECDIKIRYISIRVSISKDVAEE